MAATINHRQGTTDRPSLPRTDGMVGERLIATGIPLIMDPLHLRQATGRREYAVASFGQCWPFMNNLALLRTVPIT